MTTSRLHRARLLLLTSGLVTVAACAKDGDQGSDDGADSSGGSSTASTTLTTSTSATSSNTTDPSCIEGSEDCPCLDGIECQGTLQCVENECKPGPTFDPDEDDRSVLAGLVVPVQVDVNADEYSWSQVSGPATEILGDGANIQVPIPADANPGDVIALRISATRNTIEATFDYNITVLEPNFEDFLVGITDTEQLGTSVALDFDGAGNLWVASSEGFLSRFDPDGMFQNRYDLSGAPSSMRLGDFYIADQDDNIDVLYLGDATAQSVSAYNPANDQTNLIVDAVEGGGALGPISSVLPDGGGDLYMVNRESNQIIYYSVDDGVARVLTEAVVGPATLSFGPDANVLYVGAVGQVWRVGVLQDGTATDPSLYVDVGDPMDPLQEVGGLAFDEGGNLWIGVPGARAAHVAHYVVDGSTDIARSFSDVGTTDSSFVGLRYGRGDFDDATLYWTNRSDRTVGRIQTGLRGG